MRRQVQRFYWPWKENLLGANRICGVSLAVNNRMMSRSSLGQIWASEQLQGSTAIHFSKKGPFDVILMTLYLPPKTNVKHPRSELCVQSKERPRCALPLPRHPMVSLRQYCGSSIALGSQ
eukprot:15089399-Heterocapsa_arctica.AAC.1